MTVAQEGYFLTVGRILRLEAGLVLRCQALFVGDLGSVGEELLILRLYTDAVERPSSVALAVEDEAAAVLREGDVAFARR